jgi:Pyruvate/2-oxoacid:ferredoxin oxidoreductase delta subunit
VNNQDEITYGRAYRMAEAIKTEFEVHIQQCKLCLPGRWYCPDANLLQQSQRDWTKRMLAISQLGSEKGDGSEP